MSGVKGGVLVTGSASGIGRAITMHLVEIGARVVAFDRDERGLAELAEAAGAGDRLRTVPGDVTRIADLEATVNVGVEAFGALTAAVSAAGIWAPGSVTDLLDEQWNRAIAINLTGVFATARAALRQFLTHGGGAFIAIASDVGVQGSQNCAAYVAAKHGVVGLIRSMALDYGARGIRSNAICPSFVMTPMAQTIFDQAPAGTMEARMREVPLGRFAQPDEIAAVVAMLLGTPGSFINGAALLVDGGATAGYYTPSQDVSL